jgi:N-ethylmaleimide reductase
MANLGFTRESGNAILNEDTADLVSFGAPFIANPDLVERFTYNLPLSESNRDTYYTGGKNGYADYPVSSIAGGGNRF